ncbi:MAG: tyrosine-type recombinase/integrase, partial [Candidatus Acidiferrales bacterium]
MSASNPIRSAQAAGRRCGGVPDLASEPVFVAASGSESHRTSEVSRAATVEQVENRASKTDNRASLSPQGQYVGGQEGKPLARRRYQKGVLELRGDTWTVRFREDLIQPDDGSVKRVEVRAVVGGRAEFPTKKLARRRADEIVSRVNGLDYKPIMVATFAEFSAVWNERALAMMKPSTQKAARAHLRNHLVPQFGKLRLDEIGISAVQTLVARMVEKNLSRHMIMNVLYTLRSSLNSARKWSYLCGDFRVADLTIPARGIVKVPRFFSLAEAVAIIDAAGEPWRTIFAVAAMTGMRPGDVLGLAVDDLDFERRLIHVRQAAYYSKLQTPKSRASVAAVPMPSPLEG